MAINRGKQFEQKIQEQLEKIPNISVDRLYDVTTGYKNQNNPCDFIVYKFPHILYIECKAIHGNTLNFKSHIRENQWDKLSKKSYIKGVYAGILCWFIDLDETYWIDIQLLERLSDIGKKSFNALKTQNENPNLIIENELIKVTGNKKRVFFEYDLKKFLEELLCVNQKY